MLRLGASRKKSGRPAFSCTLAPASSGPAVGGALCPGRPAPCVAFVVWCSVYLLSGAGYTCGAGVLRLCCHTLFFFFFLRFRFVRLNELISCSEGFVGPELAKASRSKLSCVKNLVREVPVQGISPQNEGDCPFVQTSLGCLFLGPPDFLSQLEREVIFSNEEPGPRSTSRPARAHLVGLGFGFHSFRVKTAGHVHLPDHPRGHSEHPEWP